MEMNFAEVMSLVQALDNASTKGLKTEVVLNVLDLMTELAAKANTLQEIFKSMMEEYGVQNVDNRYDWSTNEKAVEITERMRDFNQTNVIITKTNTVDAEDVVKLFEGATVGVLLFAINYLKR